MLRSPPDSVAKWRENAETDTALISVFASLIGDSFGSMFTISVPSRKTFEAGGQLEERISVLAPGLGLRIPPKGTQDTKLGGALH